VSGKKIRTLPQVPNRCGRGPYGIKKIFQKNPTARREAVGKSKHTMRKLDPKIQVGTGLCQKQFMERYDLPGNGGGYSHCFFKTRMSACIASLLERNFAHKPPESLFKTGFPCQTIIRHTAIHPMFRPAITSF
jgi:hypothetical protein